MATAIDRPLERTPPSAGAVGTVRWSGLRVSLFSFSLLTLPQMIWDSGERSIELQAWETNPTCRPSTRCFDCPTVNGSEWIGIQPSSLACGGSNQ